MIAICKSILGAAIPVAERHLGEINQTDYSPLVVGGTYQIYALLFVFDRVDFLVRAPGQSPFWVPNSLFDLIDSEIPAGWEFCCTYSRPDYGELFSTFKIKYIIGYPLLVNDYQHYAGIIERDPVELQRFFENNDKGN